VASDELREKSLLPAERRLQAVGRLAGGLQDPLPVPDPDLAGSGPGADGADGEQLTVASPRDPRGAVVPRRDRVNLLQAHDDIIIAQEYLTHETK